MDTTTQIYNFIIDYKLAHDGNSPSYEQMMRHIRLLNSPSNWRGY